MNTTHHHYRVGGHLFSLALPPELVPATALTPYAPFRTEEPEADAEPLFSLTLTADDTAATATALPTAATPLVRLCDDNGSMQLFATPGGGLLIHFARPGHPVCCTKAKGMDFILDRCIHLVQDKTFGTYTELSCFLSDYLWPAYKERGFPAFYIYSALSEEMLMKRKQRTLQAYQKYIKL